ncbi:hypothetical protein ACOMHN_056589 [Nucella lapillus]
MMVIGILGNTLVLYITHFRWKSAIFNYFIKILAWLDLSNLTLALPILLAITVDADLSAFLPLCRFSSFVALFTAISSAVVLVVIAANRFRKLCHAAKSQVTLPLAKKLTVVSVLIGAAISSQGVWAFGRHTASFRGDHGPVNISCCFIQDEVSVPLMVSLAVVNGLTFGAVSTSLVVLYSLTIKALRQHDKRIENMGRRPSAVSNTSKKVSKKHTWVFIAVTVVFFVTYAPYMLMVVLLIVDSAMESKMGPVAKAFFDLAKLCPLMSNVSNPIIYSFTSDKFREECRKVFKLRPCMKALNITRKGSVTTSVEMSHSEDT